MLQTFKFKACLNNAAGGSTRAPCIPHVQLALARRGRNLFERGPPSTDAVELAPVRDAVDCVRAARSPRIATLDIRIRTATL